MAKKTFARDNVPLSRLGVLVAQLESIVASAAQQPPDPLLCFDLLSDLISAINDEHKDSILLCQRKCEDALYSLLVLGGRRPVRHLASVAMAKIIAKGDPISIYSRTSSLQGFLSDGKRSEPQRVAGAALCLGELYRLFGRRITSGFPETTSIASKLMKSPEEYVRREALYMLHNAMDGCRGTAPTAAYTEAFRLIMRFGVVDKSSIVRIAAARCLKAYANVGGPGLGPVELENSAATCVKAFSDPISSVRDAYAEALGSLLAFGMNPEAQVQTRGKGQFVPAKKLEGCLQRHLVSRFLKASGIRLKDVRISLTLAWVFFLQTILLKYLHPDSELQDFAVQVMDMLPVDPSIDAHALACVLYILRVGVVDQMTEPTQRSFSVVLGKQLQSSNSSYLMKVAALRILSYTLKTLGEVPMEFREVLDDTVVVALSHESEMVRVEAALTMRALAEVDPICISGLVSFGVTTLNALRESVSFDKGHISKLDLDSLHGQATLLAALVSVSPKLPLGYPARLPHSVLEVSKKLLTEPSRNLGAATVLKEAGWLLLASLLASIPKEEFEDQVFDILALWAPLFSGNLEDEIQQSGDLTPKIRVWSAAVDALTAFVRCYVSRQVMTNGILLQPVLVYLSSALSLISAIATKDLPGTKAALDVLIIRTLISFQSLSDPLTYSGDHPKLLQLCCAPFRDPSAYEESSCLRSLLDKRDAWLGPWKPGRDWFEDELRAFQGGKDGLMPCIWDPELHSFPQPETVSKLLVNLKLLCFGIVFSFQDSGGMLSLLGVIEQSLKAGKKQSWHAINVNNICVGLLAGLKSLLSLRPQQLGSEILNLLQNIFQSILAEGDISASLRRASCEGLGLLTRLGSDNFTARMTKTLLGDLTGTTNTNYAGSVAVALGCIHRSAGGMALSSLVPSTVSAISALARSSVAELQIWSLHGLLWTIEAAGLSFVSHVQATLNLGLEILLSEESGWVDLQQGVGRLINAIVAVLGPELAPGSIFFSRCKSVIAEISSCEETATLLENIRFTQQLVLFAPQALSVHFHVKTLLPTLSSKQPSLRHLAISTLRHLIEKDSVSVIHEQIEENLFYMLDEETDAEIGNLVQSTIMRLLFASCPTCPSRWMVICRKLVLATTSQDSAINGSSQQDPTNASGDDARLDLGEDDENMVSSSKSMANDGYLRNATGVVPKRDRHLRYRTRAFAAECLSLLPTAVGKNPAHFDLLVAREKKKESSSGDWLVLQLQELVSLAYQISTIQFESMQPIGVQLLSSIMDKFGGVPDPELPGCLLLEQYQAQLVSALRSALDMSSGPILLEAGLQLATKILISGVIRGDQAAVKRIFSLISRPLSDFEGLYYPSFAEWVSCKIKVRLLAAHASLKCYTYSLFREQHPKVQDEYMALLPLFSNNSCMLGSRWIGVLKDYCLISLNLNLKKNWTPFLEGIKSPIVSSKLRLCLEEACSVILQAVALDAVPVDVSVNADRSFDQTEGNLLKDSMSGYSMVELRFEDFQLLWGFGLHMLFQGQNVAHEQHLMPLCLVKSVTDRDSAIEEMKPSGVKLNEVVLPVFRSLTAERFFRAGFLSVDICRELLQVFTYVGAQRDSWNCLIITVLLQIVHNCPDDFLKISNFVNVAIELCLALLYKNFIGDDVYLPDEFSKVDPVSQLVVTAETLLNRIGSEMQLMSVLAFMLTGYNCAKGASTEPSFSKIIQFSSRTFILLENFVKEKYVHGHDTVNELEMIIGAGQNALSNFIKDCIEAIHLLESRKSSLRRLVYAKLAFSLEQILSFAHLQWKMGLSPETDCCINMAVFCGCIRSFQLALIDATVQVEAIALQVLKNIVQKSTDAEAHSFLLLLSGELFGDILMVIQKTMTKPVTRESAAFVGECLKTLVLMQTIPKVDKCQKVFINLVLEVVFMILSGTEDRQSEETNDLRSTVIRFVSQIVQVPSVAVHLKEVLLGMSGTDRQQIQDIIRASVTQEQQMKQVKSNAGTLEIKLPRAEEIKQQNSPASPSDQDDEYPDDEDDWDAFQSFSTATNANTGDAESNAENSSIIEPHTENSSIIEPHTEDDGFRDFSSSLPPTDAKETPDAFENAEEEEVTLEPPLKSGLHENNDLTLEASQSEALDQDSGQVSPSFHQPGSSAEDADKVDLVVGNPMNNENPSDSMNHQAPTVSPLVEDSRSGKNLEDFEASSSEDLKASHLEADNRFREDQSLESAADYELNASAVNDDTNSVEDCSSIINSGDLEATHSEPNNRFHEDQSLETAADNEVNASAVNENLVYPNNVSNSLQISENRDICLSTDPKLSTHGDSRRQSSVEGLDIDQSEGTTTSTSTEPTKGQHILKPEILEVAEEDDRSPDH